MIYGVEFPDGSVKQYSANVISNHMYLQVDQDLFSQKLLISIINYRNYGHAVTNDDMYVTTKSNPKILCQTTVGWKLLG